MTSFRCYTVFFGKRYYPLGGIVLVQYLHITHQLDYDPAHLLSEEACEVLGVRVCLLK